MSSPQFYIKQSDTAPILAVEVSADPTDVLASATFRMMDKKGVEKINASANIEQQPSDTQLGIVSYAWATGDTDDDGVYLGEFSVTYADGRIETFPNTDYIQINVMGKA